MADPRFGRSRLHQILEPFRLSDFWIKRRQTMRICNVVFGISLALAAPAAAQTAEPGVPRDDKCQVQPEPGREAVSPDTKSLAEVLDDCNGVLQPPPTGDGELTLPAPDAGETPVIRPGDIPQQDG